MSRQSSVELLPGLMKYTDRQQMWLATALSNCGGSEFSDKSQTYRLSKRHWENEVHAGRAFRVLGPLSNSKQFSEDWGCPRNSMMNPDGKCTVWGKDI